MSNNFLKLGWENPRPNDFEGPDLRPLKDLFGNLQRFLTFPYVGLRFSGTFDLTNVAAVVPMTVKSGATAPFVPGDPYSLYRTSTSQIQVPRDFDTWLAIGATGALTAGGAASAVFSWGWRINSTVDVWFSHSSGNVASRATTPLIAPVRKGDTIDLAAASSDATEDLTTAEAWVFFIPLA